MPILEQDRRTFLSSVAAGASLAAAPVWSKTTQAGQSLPKPSNELHWKTASVRYGEQAWSKPAFSAKAVFAKHVFLPRKNRLETRVRIFSLRGRRSGVEDFLEALSQPDSLLDVLLEDESLALCLRRPKLTSVSFVSCERPGGDKTAHCVGLISSRRLVEVETAKRWSSKMLHNVAG